MLIEAFAKINWSLNITGVRPDGYHLMDMLMQPVSICDEITLQKAPSFSLSVSGYPPVRADRTNLAWKAAELLKEFTGYEECAAIHIQKRIPVGAGLGGGSADAAAVLHGLNRLWETVLSRPDLEKLGLQLGADVPFCLRGGLTRTTGIGEELTDLPCPSNYWLVIVQPCRGLSTGAVFKAWKDSPKLVRPEIGTVERALMSGDAPMLAGSIGNVLQPVSVSMQPAIGKAIDVLQQQGASAACMTGSGSAVFGLFRSGNAARSAFSFISRIWHTAFLCHTQQDSLRIVDS